MESLLELLGSRVRERREGGRLTRRELAHRSGVSERFLSSLEGGTGNVSVLKLEAIAHALGTDASTLLACRKSPQPGAIALLGLRGAGKSTLGAALAQRLSLPFFELDQLVEARAGLTLGEVFAVHGEAYYRRLELEALRELFDRRTEPCVIATGGGIVQNREALELLEQRATTIWLKADPEDHWSRVVRQGDRRPMRGNPQARRELRAILDERKSLYARAHHTVDTSRLGFKASLEALRRLTEGVACHDSQALAKRAD